MNLIMLKQKLVWFVCFLCLFQAKAQQALTSIKTYKQFQTLAGNPLNSNLGKVEAVKVVYDLKQKTLYFINGHRYKFHFEFCSGYLFDDAYLERFNRINYGTSEEREYLLGNINLDAKQNVYFIDLSVFDYMPEEQIIQLYQVIRENVYFKDRLRFLLNTERLLGLESALKEAIQVMKPAELYENKTYQRVSAGKCTGRIRFVPNLDSLSGKEPLQPYDILVTKGTPKYIPNVVAIILNEFQTPLSHLSVLGVNRKIPIAVDKLLIKDTAFRKLDWQWITLEVSDTRIWYKESGPKYRETNNGKLHQLAMDTTRYCEIVSVADFKNAGADAIGNKAYNFGLLNRVQETGRFKAPESAFAIPFYFYLKHVNTPRIKTLLEQLKTSGERNDESLRKLLEEIRSEIKNTPLDPVLVADIRKILEQSEFTTFRFRSSTNAEDASGFSGAGLYESKTVSLSDTSKTIEKAILKVWASLWSYEAFQERRFFHISDEYLAMGILVHRSFPEEEANGVVITKNMYRPDYEGMTINVQIGDVPVVDPPPGITCDQLVIIHELEASQFNRSVEYISNSNLSNGKTVLSEEEVKCLEFAVRAICEYFWEEGMRNKKLFSFDLVLDIEFKFQGKNRELYIKQARFFNE